MITNRHHLPPPIADPCRAVGDQKTSEISAMLGTVVWCTRYPPPIPPLPGANAIAWHGGVLAGYLPQFKLRHLPERFRAVLTRDRSQRPYRVRGQRRAPRDIEILVGLPPSGSGVGSGESFPPRSHSRSSA